MTQQKPTAHSHVSFTTNGEIYSTTFDDIYFDSDTGGAQSLEVFIQGNNLEQRFAEFLATKQAEFTLIETGFGTGLNFILAVKAYLDAMKNMGKNGLTNKQLRFISVEKYPLTKAQMQQALAIIPELKCYTDELVNNYPKQINNEQTALTISLFEHKVSLQLIFNDATVGLQQLADKQSQIADAFFLDGFAPAKNPQMWQPELFEQLARLAKPQASIATFTVAGVVRRGLQQAGFRIQKHASSGHKAEILIGQYQQQGLKQSFMARSVTSKPQRVTVIGGGIAAACCCYALTQAGIQVTLLCKDQHVAQGASSNAIGAVYPLLRQIPDDLSQFYAKAFGYAKHFYQQLYQQGYKYDHSWQGLIELSYKPALIERQKQFEQQANWPDNLIQSITAKQASQYAGITLPYGGLFHPNAGWVAPQQLVQQIFKAALATDRLSIQTNTEVTQLNQTVNKQWQLSIKDQKKRRKASHVVVCTGAESINLPIIDQLPLQAVRGQVTQVTANNDSKNLKAVLCHKGYITPANHQLHCIGATFEKDSLSTVPDTQDDQYNLAQIDKHLPELFNWQLKDIRNSKARSRCSTPDHLPIVGLMPDINEHIQQYPHLAKDKNWRYQQAPKMLDGLYVLTGLGARGLCSAPLLAQILTAELCNTPYPVDDKMLFNLAANRFVIRDIIKRKYLS